MLPTGEFGVQGCEVGFINAEPRSIAEWLSAEMGNRWMIEEPGWRNVAGAMEALTPRMIPDLYGLAPLKDWTVLMNNTVLGTDLGVLPRMIVDDFDCTVIRAVVSEPSAKYKGRILAVWGPGVRDAHKVVRSIEAVNDGGHWVFVTYGVPYEFEDMEAYSRRLKRDRFTNEMLYRYLGELGVPYDVEPEWERALAVTTRRIK